MIIHLYRYAVIGGDKRQVHLAQLLAEQNAHVSVYGLCADIAALHSNGKLCTASSLEAAVQHADHVILPAPLFKKNLLWGASYMPELTFQELLFAMQPRANLHAGCIPSFVKELAQKHHIACHDYMEDSYFCWQNTIATAEGMLAEALSRSPHNLTNSNCVVLGYGKCGSTLVSYLRPFTHHICVYEKDALQEAHSGLFAKCLNEKQLPQALQNADFIFNTVPALILTDQLLQHVNPDALLLDLASSPGGIDYESAKKLALNAVLLPGLPGKYAPYSSARIMLDYLERLSLSTK